MLATSLGYIVGAGMILVYLSGRRRVVRFCRVKLSPQKHAPDLAQCGVHVPAGTLDLPVRRSHCDDDVRRNYVFIRYLGEDGVAAFSIACYFFPIIFMVYNAIG